MNITNITDLDIDNTTETIINNEDNNDIVIEITPLATLITIIPCGLSLICLMFFMVYSLVKPLFNKK